MKKKNRILIFKIVAIVVMISLIPACEDFKSAGTVTDKDGNVYQTVVIGTQTWMRENLKTTKFNDGTEIPLVTDGTEWIKKIPAYCWYDNDIKYKKTYGALYNYFTINTGKLAPAGWHVATEAEWEILSVYLSSNPGKSENSASALASSGEWQVTGRQVNPYSYTETDVLPVGCDKNKNNSSGFNAQPGGYRDAYNNRFISLGYTAIWWCSNSGQDESNSFARCFNITYQSSGISVMQYYSEYGYSVRCIKD